MTPRGNNQTNSEWAFYKKIELDSSKNPSHKKKFTTINSSRGKKRGEDVIIECNIRPLIEFWLKKKARKFGRGNTERI